MKIAYVVSSLKVSMTFVVNELEAHEQAGWQVLPLVSCKPGPFENLSELLAKWNKRAFFRPNVFIQLGVTLREIITHPLRFARICFWLVTLLVHSPLEFAKALIDVDANKNGVWDQAEIMNLFDEALPAIDLGGVDESNVTQKLGLYKYAIDKISKNDTDNNKKFSAIEFKNWLKNSWAITDDMASQIVNHYAL